MCCVPPHVGAGSDAVSSPPARCVVCVCAVEQAGHAGAPLGYVVPAFRGGGISMDYALRDGEKMMENGQITAAYRSKYQQDDVSLGKAGKK